MDKAAFLDFVVEVVRRLDDEPSFAFVLIIAPFVIIERL